MSKFYVQGNISDESSEEEQQKNINIDKNNRKKFDVDDDDYDKQQKGRIIQTQSEKKHAIFKKLSVTTIAALNINDFDKAWDNLQQFLKQIEKSTKLIQKEGLPNVFLRTLKLVNEKVTEMDPQTKKNLKNPKSFNIMKQKLKNKIVPQYKQKLQTFKDEPSEQESSDEQSVSSSSEEQQQEYYKKFLDSDDPYIRRKYWLIRQKSDKSDDEEKQTKRDKKQEKEKQQEEQKKNRKKSGTAKPKYHLMEVKKKKQQTNIKSAKEAEAKISKILKQFAKISTAEKREEYLQTLNSILKQSKGYQEFQQLSLLLVDIPIRLEVTRQMTKQSSEPYVPRHIWNKVFDNVVSIFTLLRESEDEDLMDKIATFQQKSDVATYGTTEKNVYLQIKTFINSLERELSKTFDYLQTNEAQYTQRLQDLVKFVQFIYKLSKQMTFKEDLEQDAAQISFKVLENMYFMSNQFLQKIKKSNPDLNFVQLSDSDMLEVFVKPIFKLNNEDYTTKTLLYLIYNHAVNRRDKAKDLLIMTDISELITTRDYYTQICFNRALVQLGISSFHQGNLYQTQQILSSICSMGKSREENKQNIKRFLGQAKMTDKDAIRHKILPYYLHFNIDLIEAIELIASMVLQIPFTLTEGGKITSKSFKKVAYQYERSHFIAEPLNYRDLVYAASNQLKLGNMKQCLEKLKQINIWNQIGNRQQALENLKTNVKETALKCYILANRNCFVCLSLEGLAKKFEMDVKTVKKLICRQINQRKIQGKITSDGYLNLTEKRKEKQSGLRHINNSLFLKLQEINKNNQLIFKQRQEAIPDQQQQIEKQPRVVRRLHDAITDKLRNILNRRAA